MVYRYLLSGILKRIVSFLDISRGMRFSKGRKYWAPIHTDRSGRVAPGYIGAVIHTDEATNSYEALDGDGAGRFRTQEGSVAKTYPPLSNHQLYPTRFRNPNGSINKNIPPAINRFGQIPYSPEHAGYKGGYGVYRPGGYHYWINGNGDVYQLVSESRYALGTLVQLRSNGDWLPNWVYENQNRNKGFPAGTDTTDIMNQRCIQICLNGHAQAALKSGNIKIGNETVWRPRWWNTNMRTSLVELLLDLAIRGNISQLKYNVARNGNSNGFVF